MLATTTSHSARARRISASWPAWSAPIVGTSPMREPARDRLQRRAEPGDRPVDEHQRAATAAVIMIRQRPVHRLQLGTAARG